MAELLALSFRHSQKLSNATLEKIPQKLMPQNFTNFKTI